MSINSDMHKSSDKLRQLAIEKLNLENTIPQKALSAQKTEDLFHELRVHQIELEMQNEELKHSQEELELSREKYFKLYDVAPIGYCTLSETGLVIESNLKVCELFGLDRIYLKRQLFSSFIFKDDLIIYYQAVKNLSKTGDSQTCEVRFIRRNRTSLWVLLDISSMQDADGVILYLVAVSDITGCKQTEIELQREHERLSNILEGTNSGTWEWNVQTGETALNDRWAEIIGFTLKEISPVSIKTWKRIIHPEDLKKCNEQLDKVFNRESEYYDIECRMKHKNGSWVWVQDRGKVISWTSKEKPLLMSGTHTDITERKQTEILSDQMVVFAEEMLKTGKEQITSEKILENLLFISKAKYGVLTLKSNITNKFTTVAVAGIKNNVKKLSKLLGFELVGREWDDYSEKNRNPEGQVVSFYSSITESIERVNYKNLSSPFEKLFDLGETVVTKIIIENEVIGEFRLIMPYGQKFKMDSFVEIYSRQIDMFFTRKKVENALIEANHRQEMANAAGGVGIWNLNLTTNELTWDDQMFALYGITRKQFTSVYQAWISGLHPEDAERGDREIQMAARGEKEFDTEFRVVWPDGTIHHINARAQVRRDGTGKPLEMIGTNYDITNRKRAEEAVLHLSYHDQLTGLFNRRFFEEEIKRLDTDRQLPLSIIVGDLNNLKLTNDTFGHLEGDRLLKETSKLLKTACRSDDILARWGGDEFVILLPKTSIASAEEIAQRIEKGCSELFIQKIPIGLAIGIAAKTKHRQNIEDIILEAESNMYKNKLAGKQGNAGSVILALEQALYEKSNETMEHAQRLKELSLKLGKKLKLHSHQLDELSLFASLHDIGKVAVPETILLKEGALSEKEWEVIKRHSETGFNIAQSSPQIAHIAKYILSCHENWDGSGYPVGLAKEEIPLLSRIVFIADSYDIMTCKRTYKTAMSKEGAVIELKRCAGTQFDPTLVEKFLEVLAEQAK